MTYRRMALQLISVSFEKKINLITLREFRSQRSVVVIVCSVAK